MVANMAPLLGWVIVSASLLSLSAQWVTAQTGNLPPPPQDGYPFDSKVRVSPTMAIILICLICTFFVMGCISVYVRRWVERRMARRSFTLEADGVGSSRRTRRRAAALGLNTAVIEAFPTFMYSEVKGLKIGKGALECAVCLNEFEDEETLRLLPKCCHVFHPDCIDAWLSSHITCPVCRANLNPKPGETRSFTVLSHEPETEAGDSPFSPEIRNHDPQNINSDRVADDVIADTEFREAINGVQTPNRFHPTRSTPGEERPTGSFRKSFSTGHSLVQPGEDCERFTLRLPEDVRNQLVSTNLSRTKSCVAFPRARSSRKGYRCGSGRTREGKNFNYERFDREGRFMMTPPFFSRAGSARSPKIGAGGGGGEESTAGPKTLLMSVRSPLRRLFAMDNRRDDVNVGERSFDRLRLGCDEV